MFLSVNVFAAQIDITFNGVQADLDDFTNQYSYQENVPDPVDPDQVIPNPETRKQFFIRTVQEFVWGSVKAQRVNIAGDDARQVELDKTVNF